MTGRYAFLVATPAPKCASIAGSALFPSPPPSYGAGCAKTRQSVERARRCCVCSTASSFWPVSHPWQTSARQMVLV